MIIEVLYPEFANLFADAANIRYLKSALPKAKFVETNVNKKPYFVENKVDLLYMGSMTENQQEVIISRLEPYKLDFKELINNGTNILFTGNAIEVLGNSIEDKDGTQIKALGIFDICLKRDMLNRKSYTQMGNFEGMKIVGFKSVFTTMEGKFQENYFMETEVGLGNNSQTNKEGLRKNNFIGTYTIGPLLVLNPLFTKWLLRNMGCGDCEIPYEKELMEAYEYRVDEYKRKFL